LTGVRVYWVHYLLPILPSICALTGHGINVLWHIESSKKSWRILGKMAVALLFVFALLRFPQIMQNRQDLIHKVEQSKVIAAGRWISDHYSRETTVFCTFDCYIPPEFERLLKIQGDRFSPEIILKAGPQLIVTQEGDSAPFKNAADAGRYLDGGPKQFEEKRRFFEALESGKLPYRIVAKFSPGIIYELIMP